MARVTSEAAARRLAQAIAADIKLYNAERTPEDLAAAVEEGRELYRTRVAPEHLALYDAVLLEQGIAASSSALHDGASPAPRAPSSFFQESAPKPAPGPPVLAIAIAAVVLVALLAFFAR